jgi:hypothetical protein
MVSSATEIRNLLESSWSLTGELSKTSTAQMDIPVKFFDRAQVKGNETPKSITVEKINKEGNETIINHPTFNEVKDMYEITLHYRIRDVLRDNFSTSLENVELMGDETIRILKTKYNPSSTAAGEYFRVQKQWVKEDMYNGNQPEFRRRLFFTISKIVSSQSTDVFTGFGGVLLFDKDDSEGDLPDSDYSYVAVKNVNISEGYSQIPILTKDVSKGIGVPNLFRGLFSGRFSAVMYAEKSNIIGSTVDKLQKIYRAQTSGSTILKQIPEVVFLHTNKATIPPLWVDETVYKVGDEVTESSIYYKAKLDHTAAVGNKPPNGTYWEVIKKILSTKSFMKIDNISLNSPEEDLLTMNVDGMLTRPTVYAMV